MTTKVLSLVDQIQPLLDEPLFLSQEHARYNVLPVIVKTILCISLIYICALPIAHRIPQQQTNSNSNSNSNKNEVAANKRRLSYQITNLITNAFLGLLGLHAQYNLLPEHPTTRDKIQGLDELSLLGSVQIGFQLWSIFMGLFVVQETIPMFLHHACVICASSKVAFLTNGFRYFAPLALGMTELSSVPLAVMNAFKNNPEWIEAFPQAYVWIRLIFSVSFLFIRIYKFVPQHLEYLQVCFLVPYLMASSKSDDSDDNHHYNMWWWYRMFMYINWVGACFLLALQLYWGYLIVKAMLKFVQDNHQAKKLN